MTNILAIPAANLRRGMILADAGSRIDNIARGPVNTHLTLANGTVLVFKHYNYVRVRKG